MTRTTNGILRTNARDNVRDNAHEHNNRGSDVDVMRRSTGNVTDKPVRSSQMR